MRFRELDVCKTEAADLGPSQSAGEPHRENGGVPDRPRSVQPLAGQIVAARQHPMEVKCEQCLDLRRLTGQEPTESLKDLATSGSSVGEGRFSSRYFLLIAARRILMVPSASGSPFLVVDLGERGTEAIVVRNLATSPGDAASGSFPRSSQ